jgi:hypothetical protein
MAKAIDASRIANFIIVHPLSTLFISYGIMMFPITCVTIIDASYFKMNGWERMMESENQPFLWACQT